MKINKLDKEYKSYANICWILWFIFITAFVTGNIFKIYLLKDIPFDIFMFGLFIIVGVFYSVSHMRLLNYLKKNHYEKWKELTTTLYFGSGSTNGMRVMDFLDSKETLDDSIVSKLKSECKKIILLSIVHAISFIVLFLGLNFLRATGFNAPLKYFFMKVVS